MDEHRPVDEPRAVGEHGRVREREPADTAAGPPGGGPAPDADADGARLRATLEALPLAALLQSPTDRVVAVNHRLIRLFGLQGRVDTRPGAPAAPIAEVVAELLPPGYPSALGPARDAARHRFPRTTEVTLTDGRTLRRGLHPLHDGGRFLGVLWTAQDITERKRAERDLERDNRALAELVRQANEFTAAASHELRTPLTSILSFCELLADPASGEMSRDQREFLAAIRRNAERMRGVIADLLLAGRTRASRLELEFDAVRVPRMLEHAVIDRMATTTAAGVFVCLDCAEGPALRGDEHRLQHVLANLLENAAKFTPRGGRIDVTGRVRADHWEIEVADTGIGVPEEFREEIFHGFKRAPNAQRGGYPGTGLGLAVSRDIVRLHGGELTVGGREDESGREGEDGREREDGREGRGARFLIRLPVAGPREPA
ncbi:ATP-binding protein [Streptomyces sp. URMC 123]|uniref:sensor histidine kinase n=1 Tax=Streptomyces sp. URMC 123 TaxID=3423403 RepID=UPI003F1AD058